MADTAAKEKSDYDISLPWFGLPRLLPYVKPHRRLFLSMVIASLFCGLIDILTPRFQQYALNHFIADNTLDKLGVFILLYLLLMVCQGAINYYMTQQSARLELYMNRDLRQAAFNHLQTLSFSYFNHNSVGYVHARVMSDTGRISESVSWVMMDIVWSIVYICGALFSMLAINPRLALTVILVLPLLVFLSVLFRRKFVVWQRKARETNSRITGAFNEGITGAPTAKSLVIEDKMTDEFRELSQNMRHASVRSMHFRGLFRSFTVFASFAALAMVLWQGGNMTREGLMLVGTLSLFVNYAQGMTDPIQNLIADITSLSSVQVNIERFTKLMDTQSDVRDREEVTARYGDSFAPKRENWEPLKGDVEFRDVTFRYPDGDENVLEHFDLKVPRGMNVAIVGETGAGKSTLVNLVCRFFEPSSGRVLIDGRDARDRSELWLHSHIGYVLQTPHLFSGSILENLRYGKPDATEEEVMEALRAVSAQGIVERMPEGLASQVGEGGNALSTGEKQLLSFARAILADPAIFVLDEATSSVDTETERLIQDAIEKLMKGRTSFVIAHRLSTIRRSDLILVVNDGRIIEQGSHRELMARKGYYWSLYTRQYREEKIRDMV